MVNWLRNLALSYRPWLTCALICFGMSVLLGYHQYQVMAQQTLAEKLAFPPEVMLQDFNAQKHSNMLEEVRLVGEAALDRTITINIGAEDNPNWVQIVPFYPVGVESLIAAFQYLENSPIQAMRSETRQQLAASAWHIRGMQDSPMAMLLIEAGMSIDEAVLHNFIGEGTHGPLVAISGSTVEARAMNAQAMKTFSAAGTEFMSDMPMVLPYPNGQRVSGYVQDYSQLRNLFTRGFAIFAFIGLYCAFGLSPRFGKLRAERPISQPIEPLAPMTNVFADIRTQEELSREEQFSRAPKRRVLSRINS